MRSASPRRPARPEPSRPLPRLPSSSTTNKRRTARTTRGDPQGALASGPPIPNRRAFFIVPIALSKSGQGSARPSFLEAPSRSLLPIPLEVPHGLAVVDFVPPGRASSRVPSRARLLDSHSLHCAGIGGEQVDRAAVAGGEHHALRLAEAHLARREVRHCHREPANEVLGRVHRADAGEYGAGLG